MSYKKSIRIEPSKADESQIVNRRIEYIQVIRRRSGICFNVLVRMANRAKLPQILELRIGLTVSRIRSSFETSQS